MASAVASYSSEVQPRKIDVHASVALDREILRKDNIDRHVSNDIFD